MYFKLDVNVRVSFVRAWLEVWGGWGHGWGGTPVGLGIRLTTNQFFRVCKDVYIAVID